MMAGPGRLTAALADRYRLEREPSPSAGAASVSETRPFEWRVEGDAPVTLTHLFTAARAPGVGSV